MANKDIREALRLSGVRQWELADKMGYSCAWFSIKMRKELSSEEKEKCLEFIQELAEEKKRGDKTYTTVCIEELLEQIEDEHTKTKIEKLLRR